MKTKLTGALIMAFTLALVVTIVPAMAYFNSVSFHGQGFAANGVLQTQVCGLQNGADASGSYLLWTLSAADARNAEISGPWGRAIMNRSGSGIFTYVSEWYGSADLAAQPVKATYDGKPAGATLIVSHGCDLAN
jgi:hypothetical protein